MKLTVLCLIFLVTTVVYANTLSKREESCWTQNENYKECKRDNLSLIIKIESENDSKKVLDKYCTKKCKKFYNDYKSALSSCELDKDQIKELEEEKMNYELYCTKDSSDDYCPIVRQLVDYGVINYNPEYILKQTCLSKECTDIIVNSNSDEAKDFRRTGLSDKLRKENIKTYLEYLKSEECTKQQGAKKDEKCWKNNKENRYCNFSNASDNSKSYEDPEKYVNKYCSKDCKDFYNDFSNILSNCELDDDQIKSLQEEKKNYEFYCTKDGGDNYCPYVRQYIDIGTIAYNGEFILKETCKSKKCTEAAVNSESEYAKYFVNKNLDKLKADNRVKFLDYLKSEECTKQNDAKTIAKFSSSLLLTLSLILVFLI